MRRSVHLSSCAPHPDAAARAPTNRPALRRLRCRPVGAGGGCRVVCRLSRTQDGGQETFEENPADGRNSCAFDISLRLPPPPPPLRCPSHTQRGPPLLFSSPHHHHHHQLPPPLLLLLLLPHPVDLTSPLPSPLPPPPSKSTSVARARAAGFVSRSRSPLPTATPPGTTDTEWTPAGASSADIPRGSPGRRTPGASAPRTCTRRRAPARARCTARSCAGGWQ